MKVRKTVPGRRQCRSTRRPDDATQRVPVLPSPRGSPEHTQRIAPPAPAAAAGSDVPARGERPIPVGPSRDEAPTLRLDAGPARTGFVALLIGIEGSLAGRIFEIRRGENLLGRSRSCGVCLAEDPYVSRRHARLVAGNGEYGVANLSDASPALLNGRRFEAEVLEDGDLLVIGHSVFSFRTVLRSHAATDSCRAGATLRHDGAAR